MKELMIKFIEKYFPSWEKFLIIGNRSGTDRRSNNLRRQSGIDKFPEDKGMNRRLTIERRQNKERRSRWSRGTKWNSSFAG